VPTVAVPVPGVTGVSRYSYSVERYRLSSYMPLIAERIAETAACPWRKSSTYMVIWPSVICPCTALIATHA
jgi:hypothetical protein